MSDSGIDGLARRLATPVSRRRSLKMFVAGTAALSLAGLRPRGAEAQSGTIICSPETEFCFAFTCPEGTKCCSNSNPPGKCPDNPHCCDPCKPAENQCASDGYCVAGGNTCAQCCAKRGMGECSSGNSNSYSCCAPGEIYTGYKCCKPAPFRRPCGIAESECRDNAERGAAAEIRECDAQFLGSALETSFNKSSAKYEKCLQRAHKFGRREMKRCPQDPDDKACGDGTCGSDLKCNRECQAASSHARGGAKPLRAGAEEERTSPELDRAGGGHVSAAELRHRIDKASPKINKAFHRVGHELGQIPYRGNLAPEPGLARAYASYGREVKRLRRSLGKGRGGKPQRLALEALDASLDAIKAYERAAKAKSVEASEHRAAKAARKRDIAAKRAEAARRALGCGKTC